jgi:hypothetical protein
MGMAAANDQHKKRFGSAAAHHRHHHVTASRKVPEHRLVEIQGKTKPFASNRADRTGVTTIACVLLSLHPKLGQLQMQQLILPSDTASCMASTCQQPLNT